MVRRALIAMLVLAGCDADDQPRCAADRLVEDQRDPVCLSAHELAKRATTDLVPSQDEIDAAEALVRHAADGLPASVPYLPVAASYDQARGEVFVTTSVPAAQAAWTAGRLETGVVALDDVLAGMYVTRVQGSGAHASFQSSHAVSAVNVQRALAAVDGVTVELVDLPAHTRASDLVDEGVDAASGTQRVMFTIGWGDCMLGCTGRHSWRTAVAADGSATLVEDWGDPLP